MALHSSDFFHLSRRWVSIATLLMLCIFAKPAFAQPNKPPMPVPVLAVETSQLPYLQIYPVKLEAYQQVEVHARITANIKQQFYREGQTVKKGQLLYQLDDRRPKAAYEIAMANVETAKTNLDQRERTYKRTQKLLKNRSVSEQAVDDAYSAWQAARSNLQAAQAQLQSAQIELDDTTIEAEISGVIGQRQQDVGDLVDPISGKTLLNTIVQTDRLYGLYSISDRSRQTLFSLQDAGILKLHKSPKVALLNEQGNLIVEGKLNFTDSQIDARTSSQLLRATFENTQQRLLPGQLLRVQVEHGTWQNVFSIPQKAVIQNGNQAFVYIADQGKAQMRPVQIAGAYQDQWLIEKGLKAGEQVIVGNIIKLRPNSPVQVMDKTPPTGKK